MNFSFRDGSECTVRDQRYSASCYRGVSCCNGSYNGRAGELREKGSESGLDPKLVMREIKKFCRSLT